jgi:hypothetical protein
MELWSMMLAKRSPQNVTFSPRAGYAILVVIECSYTRDKNIEFPELLVLLLSCRSGSARTTLQPPSNSALLTPGLRRHRNQTEFHRACLEQAPHKEHHRNGQS